MINGGHKRILLVEDDPSLGFVMKDNLSRKGFEVTLCTDGYSGQQTFQNHLFDLCIFDVMLPRQDGFALAEAVRSKNQEVPILFVTAKGMLEDRLSGFKAGGDDYIVKPFSMEELLHRIDVFLKRSIIAAPPNVRYSIGSYEFDCQNLTLTQAGQEKVLTQKEAEILKLLCRHQDRVLKREEILKAVWGDDDYFMGRSMDVFISKLRKYLKSDPRIQITNYHGVGFRLELHD